MPSERACRSAYVVSLELKNPPSYVEALIHFFMGEFGEDLKGEAVKYSGSVAKSSAWMRKLIDDLLNLARIGRDSRDCQLVKIGHPSGDQDRFSIFAGGSSRVLSLSTGLACDLRRTFAGWRSL